MERIRTDPVKRYFREKEREKGHEGEILARYTIGADFGFVKGEDGKKKVVVFEVNGDNSGLTIARNRQNENSSYMKRFFRERRASRNEIRERYLSLKNLYFMSYRYLTYGQSYFKDFEDKETLEHVYGKLFSQIRKGGAYLESVLYEFFEIYDTYKTDAKMLVKKMEAFKSRLKDDIDNNNHSADHNEFYEILDYVLREQAIFDSRLVKFANKNSHESQKILSDKILQQDIIPEENKIPIYNENKKYSGKQVWVKKSRLGMQGKEVTVVTHPDLQEELDLEKELLMLEPFNMQSTHVIQEAQKTVGAENAPHDLRHNHSAMRYLADVSIRRRENGEIFVVIESGSETHNIYKHTKDGRRFWKRITRSIPWWARFDLKGTQPFDSSGEEIKLATEVIEKMALNLYKKSED